MSPAAERWARQLAAWAIPQDILEAAPECPYGFPPSIFAVPTDAPPPDTPSYRRARQVLDPGAVVVDVGAGGGAASLPLAPPAARLVAVDQSQDLLAAFASAAAGRGVAHQEVCGRWPDVAATAPVGDVVVCHHVFYNVPDLVPFALALTDHARRRVVAELTATHPTRWLDELWLHFHGVVRPSGPTADDAAEVLAEAGLAAELEVFERAEPFARAKRADVVAFARRQLCLGHDREPEVDALIDQAIARWPRQAATLWWDGSAP